MSEKQERKATTYYLDEKGNIVDDPKDATQFFIREVDPKTGRLLYEDHGFVIPKENQEEPKEGD